ncbi:hypothetical protein C8J56DRAFT_195184 [Mycena floridula]|nr:hypothetical protein C8J56DRAFT_195184 [Mycena floridula]
MEITLDNSNIGTVGGDFLCHNTMHYHTHIHSSVATPGRVRGYMPAPYGRLFGRDEDIQEIIQILIGNSASGSSNSKPVRFALLGAGGQGKTALVLEVMAQLAMKECYSAENSIWVPCEKASSPALLVDVLFTSLDIRKDIRKDSHNTIQHIRHELHASPDPVILLLDNFETPWNASEARGAVARILRDIAQISHVTIFITMRAPTAPCKDIIWVEKNIQSLDPEASLKLYASIDPRLQHDNKLPELLGMLGHMALAVKLMAQHGNNTGYTVEQLISGYKITGTAMLGRSKGSDPQNSVSVSICMSLESPLVKDQVNASRLLTIIAVLPSGTTVDALRQYWAPDLDDLDATLPTLIETSLLERRNQTYFVLPVIRSYLLDPSRLPNDVRESMVDAACNFLQQHPSVTPGDSSFPDDMTARSIEEINLQAILLQASEPKTKVVAACYILASHQYQVRPRMEVIEHAVKLVSEVADQNVIGQVYHCSATMLIGLNRFDESLQQYKLTRDAFIAASRPALAALTLLDIAHVSVSMDPSKNEIHLIEQAQQELVSINTPQPIRRKWTLLRLFTPLRNRYKKTASTEAKPGNLVEESMAQCLRRLGCAHSRWGNYSDAI